MTQLNEGNWQNRRLENHVENRTCYTLKHAELNLFETHQEAQRVFLTFPDPVLASMIRGKKIMHFKDMPSFDFLPGESVIMPTDEIMCIDFPEANTHNPTKCLALRFDQSKLNDVVSELNTHVPRTDQQLWNQSDGNFHFTNDVAIHQIIQRLIFLFTENHPNKDLFSEMMIKEMLIRIMQFDNKRNYLESAFHNANSSRFAHIIQFIQQNLDQSFSIKQLSRMVHMSESAFYRAFKTELGISPNDFIIEERLRHAESMLRESHVSIKEAYLSSGFNSFSYFTRMFKKRNQINPSEYKKQQNLLGGVA